MKAEDTKVNDLEKMATMVNSDIEDYISKYDKLKTDHALTLETADKLVSPTKSTATNQSREPNNPNGYERFAAHSDLKPTYLNQDSTINGAVN